MAKDKISPALAEKYTFTGPEPGKRMYAGFGTLDFTNMDLATADALHRAGFKHLELKEIPKVKSKAKNS